MHAFTGTGRLIRLALRRDRIKLPLVLAVLALLLISSITATVELYEDPAQRLIYASTTAPSVVSRVFGGPIGGADLGSIVLNETFLFTALAVAFMSSLTVVRHTRQNEEFGRSELIESGVVSRHASLLAALIVAAGTNLLFGLITAGSLLASGLPVSGALATGAAMAAIGLSFTAVAAVTAQLADSARGANSMAALVIGVTFLLRGIGDALGTLSPDGLSVSSAFPAWLSPFGWGQQLYPFTENNWFVFGLFAGLIAILTSLAVIFMARRDIGLGMITTKLGPARGVRRLLSPFGLASRLQRGILRGWAVAVVILGVSFGAVIKEFEDIVTENEQMAEIFSQFGDNFRDSFIGFMINFIAITIAGYAIQALLRMRSEEANGQLESILGTSVSRRRWLFSHTLYAAMGIILLAVLAGLSMAATFVLTSGESWSWLWTITAAALVQAIAVFTLAGFVVLLFGLWPRLTVPIAWGSFAFCLLILQLGALLKLPQWVMNVSPFGHLPIMPGESFAIAPVMGLTAGAVILFLGGVFRFHRRDITAV